MANKKSTRSGHNRSKADSSEMGTLKELLSSDIINRLKEQADDWKAEEEKQKQEKRKQAEEARKAERKKLENNFEYLLDNSDMDWKKYK